MRRALFLLLAITAAGPTLTAQRPASQAVALQEAIRTETVDRDLRKAITQYEAVAKGSDRALAATALGRMAESYRLLGDARAAAATRARLASFQSASGRVPGTTARLVYSGGGTRGGALSPDGRYVSSLIGATGDLGIRELATGTSRNLTNSGGWLASGDYAEGSVFSPDGRQVAYVWVTAREGELRVISTAPGAPSPRTIVRGAGYVSPVAWTPDGRRLIVKRQQQDNTWQIGIVTVADGSYQSLKSLEWRNPIGFSLSPDGRFLTYDVESGTRGSSHDIMLLALDGSRETTIVRDPANDISPVWSADASQVLFLSNRTTGTTSLWRQAVADGTPSGPPALVKPDMTGTTLLGISRSGALYYHLAGASRQHVHVADLETNGLPRLPARPVGSALAASQGPAWSRDGQYLAYYSSHNPTMVPTPAASTLVVRTVSTGVERVLPLPGNAMNSPLNPGPKWFPDNRAMLILMRDAEGAGRALYRFDLETAQTDLVWRITHQTGAFFVDVSPDGRSIYAAFQGLGEGSGALVRFDIATGQETFLRKDGSFKALAVSPDGNQIASLKTAEKTATEWPSVIEVMPTAGGKAREVYRQAVWYDGTRYNTLAWASDQRFLIFARNENASADASTGELWRVPIAGGPPEKMGLTGFIKTPAVRPDGRQIAFARRDTDDDEVWMLENYLPAAGARRP